MEPQQASEVWLVQPDAAAGDPLLLLGGLDECVAALPVLVSRFDSEPACRQALARLDAAHKDADGEAQAAAGAWLRAERERADQRAAQACAEADEVGHRCDQISDPLERQPCQIDRDRRRRDCQSAREVVDLLRQRNTRMWSST